MTNVTDPEVLIDQALELEPADRAALLRALLPRIYLAQFVVLGPAPKKGRPRPPVREVITDDEAGVFVDVEGDTTIFLARVLKLFFPADRRDDVRCSKEILEDGRQLLTLTIEYGPSRTWYLYLTEIRPQHLDYFHIADQVPGHMVHPDRDG